MNRFAGEHRVCSAFPGFGNIERRNLKHVLSGQTESLSARRQHANGGGAGGEDVVHTPALASTTCSQLSRTSSDRRSRIILSTASSADSSVSTLTPIAASRRAGTSAPSESGSQQPRTTPRGHAGRLDRRPPQAQFAVFPAPPGPVRVTRRVSLNNLATVRTVSSLPMNAFIGAGRLWRAAGRDQERRERRFNAIAM